MTAPPEVIAIGLAAATLVSEDLTCIAAGQLIARGEIAALAGVAGCWAGIVGGDVALWMVGRFAEPLGRWVPADRVERAKRWLKNRGPGAVLAARFVPGMRLPLYVALGASGVDLIQFTLWTCLAATVWTPLLVLLVAHAGDAAVAPIRAYLGGGWIAIGAAILVASVFAKVVSMSLTEIGRAKLIARVSRIWRWEFWPSWLFYLPVVPWILWLSIRHRGFMTITAANPGIPHGGFVGESKYQILSSIRSSQVIATELVHSCEQLDEVVQQRGLHFPLILKPDSGQRGAGVKVIRDPANAKQYFEQAAGSAIVQPYHPGPFEAGIFYYRFPHESRGHILSITDKHFSHLTGDGRSTIEQLIWRHPRYRMQAKVFFSRHPSSLDRILAAGERFQLAAAGNHCQGTMFRDGSHLITPALEAAIDSIAQSFPGFYFGRFDIRYSDVERFKAGEDLTIIELNGVTSESTNLYDPSWSLLRAYRLLIKQWTILFRIGAANRKKGSRISATGQLISEIYRFYSSGRADPLAD